MTIKYLRFLSFLWFLQEIYCWEVSYDKTSELSLDALAKHYGYKGIASFYLTTKDGYILNILRIEKEGAENLMPVIYFHGLTVCADVFFVAGNESSPFFLSDNGFDVWLLSTRGALESRGHIKLDSRRDKDYWSYGLDEVGSIDLPAGIDFVLKHNNHERVIAIGHSQGGSNLLIMLSEVQEYNDKVALAITYGPSVYGICANVNIWNSVCRMEPFLKVAFDVLGIHTLFPERMNEFMNTLCRYTVFRKACEELGKFMFFYGNEEVKSVDWTFAFSKAWCGGSMNEALHYMQISNTGRFARFDYGPKKNLKLYNSTLPPLFHLDRITTSLILWCGDLDLFCTKKDLDKLIKNLPSAKIVSTDFKGKSQMAHVDFLLRPNLRENLLNEMLVLMKKYSH